MVCFLLFIGFNDLAGLPAAASGTASTAGPAAAVTQTASEASASEASSTEAAAATEAAAGPRGLPAASILTWTRRLERRTHDDHRPPGPPSAGRHREGAVIRIL